VDSWDELRRSVDELDKAVGRSRATHINTQAVKDDAKGLVQRYFRVVRPELEQMGVDEGALVGADLEMQALLGLANARNRKSSYGAVLKNARARFDELEVLREMRLGQTRVEAPVHSETELRLLETLQRLVPTAALSYQQALNDLKEPARLSFRGTANELREVMRETLDHLAPDSAVEADSGFKLEKGQTKPTQKQKVRYVLRSRGIGRTGRQAPEDTASLIDELTAKITRGSFQRTNLSTHIAGEAKEARQLKMWVDTVLAELLEIHE
jgi:hypothetical protein